MNKKLLTAFLIIITSRLAAQNVGIGTTSPQAPFTVAAGKTALFGNDTLGSGIKMMWIPAKAAFRAGEAFTNNYWNTDSIGMHSFAAGRNTKAKGSYSFAFGNNSIASGIGSIAMGISATASGDSSVAMGYATIASGSYATAIGSRTTASGLGSTAMGFFTTASGNTSIAIGNGSDASGLVSTAMGSGTIAAGSYSTAMGLGTTASGNGSISMGIGTIAAGNFSTSMGNNTIASGFSSIAFGTNTTAAGANSVATGVQNIAKAYGSVALGRYNDSIATSNTVNWIATDPILIIGNGSDNTSRHNATVFYKNGNTDLNGFVRLGEITEDAPRIKTKKLTGTTPSSANPNTFTFIAHGITNANKILSINVLVTDGPYQFLPHSPDAGLLYTVNTAPDNGGSIAVGVKSVAQSSSVMGKPIKILITYEE